MCLCLPRVVFDERGYSGLAGASSGGLPSFLACIIPCMGDHALPVNAGGSADAAMSLGICF